METVQHCDGIKASQLLKECRVLKINKTFLYGRIKKLQKDGVLYRDPDGGLHSTGVARSSSREWNAHNIRFKFVKPMGGTTLQGLCDFLKKYYLSQDDEAMVNPPNWEEQKAKTVREIIIKCTNNPRTYSQLLQIQKGITKFLGYLPKLRVRAELNRDEPLTGEERLWTSYLQMYYLGRIMRMYRKKRNGKHYLREEKILKEMNIDELQDHMRDEMTKDHILSRMYLFKNLFEEERNEHIKTRLQLEKTKAELDRIKER